MKYRLTVSGTIEFDVERGRDEAIRRLLLGTVALPEISQQVGVAIQELEEEATDIKVEMVEIK